MNSKNGAFEHTAGYTLRKVRDTAYLWLFTRAIYEFRLDPTAPLTFHHPAGYRLRPAACYETDMGSTPGMLRLFFPKDRYLLSFLFHDSGYKAGGLFKAWPDESEFVFTRQSRREIDELLRLMVQVEGASLLGRTAIKAGVRVGGWAGWQH